VATRCILVSPSIYGELKSLLIFNKLNAGRDPSVQTVPGNVYLRPNFLLFVRVFPNQPIENKQLTSWKDSCTNTTLGTWI
jgi:hypothetical protein